MVNNMNNICVILDNNKMQNETHTRSTLNIYPIKEKWLAFNWDVYKINGHSQKQIKNAFNKFYKRWIIKLLSIFNLISIELFIIPINNMSNHITF